MREDLSGENRKRQAMRAQAGRSLCVSETIFPGGSRHSMNMVYRGMDAGGGLKPAPQERMAGGEFVDFRRLQGAAPGTARSAGEARSGAYRTASKDMATLWEIPEG
jgi:hypothetical protein